MTLPLFTLPLVVTNPALAQLPDAQAQQRAERETEAQQQRNAVQRQEQERVQRQQPADVRLQTPGTEITDMAAFPLETACFAIHAVRIALPGQLSPAQRTQGVSALPQDTFHFLLPMLEPCRERCIGHQGINLIVQRLAAAILAAGYATTRLGIAEQDLSAGILTLTLIPGVIASIAFSDDNLHGSWRNAFPARAGDLLNLRALEQGLEQMKRVPSQDVEMQILPSALPGESDVLIHVTRSRVWKLSASLDDSGANGTGRLQAGLNLAIDNPLGLNDLFNIGINTNVDRSSGQHGTNGNNLAYSLPYGFWHASISGNSYRYHQRIAGLYQTFTASGKSDNLDLKLSYLLQRSQRQKNSVQFRIGKRWSQAYIENVELQNQRRNTTFAELAWLHKLYLGNAQLDLSVASRWGSGWLNGAADSPARPGNYPSFLYALQTIDASLVAPFMLATQALTYVGSLRGQTSQSSLYPTEQFVIGNRYSVRGFDGELSLAAERGFFIRNEIDMPVGISGQSTYMALDGGRVFGPATAQLAGSKLAGTSLGLRGSFANLNYDVFIGRALYRPEHFHTSAHAAGFSLLYRY